MNGTDPTDRSGELIDLADYVPALRSDIERRDIGDECAVWAPDAVEPTLLDPVATVMLAVVDGEGSVRQIAADVHDEVGVPLELAQRQVVRTVTLFARLGLLDRPPGGLAPSPTERPELFASTTTPCSESTSQLGTVSFNLRLGDETIRIACDSRRGAKRLRSALADHILDGDDGPLGFVLTAPQGLQRHHTLIDRSGFVLSRGRGLDSGLHALAGHLTALLPPARGSVRVRARAVVSGSEAVVCLFPLLYVPAIEERVLARVGWAVVDRLALDIDLATGQIMNPEVPWPELAALGPGPAHAGPGGAMRAAVLVTAAPEGSGEPTRAAAATALAASGLHGSRGDLLDAAIRLSKGAAVRAVPPQAARLAELLVEQHPRRSAEPLGQPRPTVAT